MFENISPFERLNKLECLSLASFFRLERSQGAVVEQLTLYPKVKASNPSAGQGENSGVKK
jgi:hypothetical protein